MGTRTSRNSICGHEYRVGTIPIDLEEKSLIQSVTILSLLYIVATGRSKPSELETPIVLNLRCNKFLAGKPT